MLGMVRGFLALGGGLALSLAAGIASAQTATFTDWQDSPGIVLRPLGGPVPDWDITVGGGVAALPAYEGSNSTRLMVAPDLDIRYSDVAYLSVGEGLGVNLLRGTMYRAGIGLTDDPGREHNAASRLSGTGNVDPTPVAKAFVQYAFLPVVLSIDIEQALTSYQGTIADFGAYLPIVGTEKIQVFVGPEITVADSRYMQAYFGITANQAAHSRFSVYRAGAGVKDGKFGLSAFYHFDDHWFVDATLGIERLLGSAASSPLIQTRWGMSAASTVNYTF